MPAHRALCTWQIVMGPNVVTRQAAAAAKAAAPPQPQVLMLASAAWDAVSNIDWLPIFKIIACVMLVCLLVTLLLPWMLVVVVAGWQHFFWQLGFGGECARPPAPSDALRPHARRMRARSSHAFGGVADARLPRCRRSVMPTRGDDGVVPSPSPLVSAPSTSTPPSPSTSTTTSVCMFYPPGTCCPLAEALPPVQLYCVVRCLRAAQLTTSGAWVAPRLIGSEIFECADSVVPDGRVDRVELPALAECMRVRPDVAALVTC